MKNKKLMTLISGLALSMSFFAMTAAAANAAEIPVSDDAGLRKAVATAVSGDKIVLDGQVELNDLLQVDRQGEAIEIDFNGNKIVTNNPGDCRGIEVKAGTLTFSGEGGIDSRQNCITCVKGGKVIVNGGNYTTKDHDTKTAILNLSGELEINEGVTVDAAFYAVAGGSGATTVINGGTFTSTSFNDNNSWAYCVSNSGVMTINNGTFKGIQGALTTTAGGTTVINNGTFETYETEASGTNSFYTCYAANNANVTINGGSFTTARRAAVFVGDEDKQLGGASIYIKGGSFKSNGGADAAVVQAKIEGNLEISGGTYSSDVSKYLAEGVNMASTDGKWYSVTLQEAINAAETGARIKMLADVDISDQQLVIPAGKDITLDLNGKEIKSSNTVNHIVVLGKMTLEDSVGIGKIYSETDHNSSAGYSIIEVYGEFTMNSGYIYTVREDPENKGNFAVGAINKYSDCKVTINGGRIEAGWYAVAGNGSNTTYNSTITINGGELISTADYAIYHPQAGTLDVNGGIISGAAGGIHMNRGTVNVSGGDITSLNISSTGNWSDGTGKSTNHAINFAAGLGDVTANITGGKFSTPETIKIFSKGTKNKVALDITGGTYSSDITPEISIAEGYSSVAAGDGYVVCKQDTGAVVEDLAAKVEEPVKEAIKEAIRDTIVGFDESASYRVDLLETSTVEKTTGAVVEYTLSKAGEDGTKKYAVDFDIPQTEGTSIKVGVILYNLPTDIKVDSTAVYLK